MWNLPISCTITCLLAYWVPNLVGSRVSNKSNSKTGVKTKVSTYNNIYMKNVQEYFDIDNDSGKILQASILSEHLGIMGITILQRTMETKNLEEIKMLSFIRDALTCEASCKYHFPPLSVPSVVYNSLMKIECAKIMSMEERLETALLEDLLLCSILESPSEIRRRQLLTLLSPYKRNNRTKYGTLLLILLNVHSTYLCAETLMSDGSFVRATIHEVPTMFLDVTFETLVNNVNADIDQQCVCGRSIMEIAVSAILSYCTDRLKSGELQNIVDHKSNMDVILTQINTKEKVSKILKKAEELKEIKSVTLLKSLIKLKGLMIIHQHMCNPLADELKILTLAKHLYLYFIISEIRALLVIITCSVEKLDFS